MTHLKCMHEIASGYSEFEFFYHFWFRNDNLIPEVTHCWHVEPIYITMKTSISESTSATLEKVSPQLNSAFFYEIQRRSDHPAVS